MAKKEKSNWISNEESPNASRVNNAAAPRTKEEAEFQAYSENEERAVFNYINALYKRVRAELNANNGSPASLTLPVLKTSPRDYSDGAIASYSSMLNRINVYHRGYKMYLDMKKAEANGDTFMADKLRYDFTHVIGHELGHALTHSAFFDSEQGYDYREGLWRRKDDGLAEVIGFYIAQKVNGRPVDNGAIADAMLDAVRNKQESFLEFNDRLQSDWATFTDGEKAAKMKDIELHATRSVYYDYAIIGFATALKANPNMDLAELIKTALASSEQLDGLDKYVLNITGPAAELEQIDMTNAFKRLLRGKQAAVDEKEAQEQMRLQGELSREILDKIAAMTGNAGKADIVYEMEVKHFIVE
jgi:hypothetical protein